MDRSRVMEMFCRTAERLSLTQAADDLNVTNAAISRQIAKLEDHLGVKLLARSTRRVKLTDAGEKFYEAARRALAELERAERVAVDSGSRPGGRFRISSPMSLGIAHLSSIAGKFSAAHPDIELELILDDHVIDIISEHFDVALRVRTSLPDSSLFAKPLASVRRVLCASPAYLRGRQTPARPDDLPSHSCLAYTLSSEVQRWSFSGPQGERHSVTIGGSLSFNNSLALSRAALEGAGIALVPLFCVREEIESGRLVSLLQDYAIDRHTLYAVHAYGAMLPAGLKALFDFISHEFDARQIRGEI